MLPDNLFFRRFLVLYFSLPFIFPLGGFLRIFLIILPEEWGNKKILPVSMIGQYFLKNSFSFNDFNER